MAKKAANPAPVASENVSEEVVTSTVPATVETPETEATTSTAIDQPAVSDDASASSSSSDLPDPVSDPSPKDEASEEGVSDAPSSPADPAILEVVVIQGGGGSFEPLAISEKPALTMVERIEMLEKRVAELEAK